MTSIISRIVLLSFLISGIAACSSSDFSDSQSAIQKELPKEPTQKIEPKTVYGIQLAGSTEPEYGKIRKNEFLSHVLSRYDIDALTIHKLAESSEDVFDLRHIRAGNGYCVIRDEGSDMVKCFVYEENKVDYVVFNLEDSIYVYRGKKEVVETEKYASGVINSSLYVSLVESDAHPDLAIRMSEIYAWTIDFYRIQKGDKFKVKYIERSVDGESIGIGEISASVFNHFGEDLFAFYYETDSVVMGDYFDEEGKNLRKAFLQTPVKFSRISSRYSKRRFHPVQKRYKAHLGTDYAAPKGTPIYSTADGVITHRKYKKHNGNYVKVRHNGTYTTQYLHMSSFAKGQKVGDFVKQGQVIGYVGSTGLATGPHVCYRFWKNDKQVDPYKQDLPDADPISDEHRDAFFELMELRKAELDALQFDRAIAS